jgi:methylphosphotriester-DNA--protein-cysteine methyltransferase
VEAVSGLTRDVLDRARRSRDARFDGRFFIAVRSTRIYCRPICPARLSNDSNVRYYATAEETAEAGYRPCLRCRPEAAPGSPAWAGTSAVVQRALRLIQDGALDQASLGNLANRLGIGVRHLSRLFAQHVGASPATVAQTRRLHFAKRLLDDTCLPITDIAHASGFGSIRRFNDVFRETYQRSPRELRKIRRSGSARMSFRPGPHGSGAATALNDRGQIVGISGDCDNAVGSGTAKHAVLWENGVAIELANPFGAAAPYWNTPMMINEHGDVVGFAGVPNDPAGNLTPPFLWTKKGGWHWLPLLQGDIAGVATSINNSGVIVGYSNDANGNFHPWVRVHGLPKDLNDLIEPGSGMTGPILLALDINDRGEITGTTTTGRAIVARPVWRR